MEYHPDVQSWMSVQHLFTGAWAVSSEAQVKNKTFFSELGMLCSFLCIFLVLVEMRAWRAGTDLRLRLLCSWTLLPVPLACVWLCLFKMGREVQSPLSRCCCGHSLQKAAAPGGVGRVCTRTAAAQLLCCLQDLDFCWESWKEPGVTPDARLSLQDGQRKRKTKL